MTYVDAILHIADLAALATARKEVDEMVSAGMAYLFSGKKKNRLC